MSAIVSEVAASPRAPDVPKVTGIAFLLRALHSRNYRLFFTGQSISLIGSWMTRIATSWLVYRLTHSAWMLGAIGFAGMIPAFFLAPFVGVLIDRVDRHRLLVLTQALAMLQSLALAALTLTHRITLREILALSLFQGVINAFDMPTRQSFVVKMVERKEDLSNAIALNSSMVNGARLIGPSIAGVLIASSGEGWCFLIDGLSYLAVIVSLLMMVLPPRAAGVPSAAKPHVFAQLTEGWRYVAGSAPIRAILLLLGLISLVGMPYTVLMPIFANQILHGGAGLLGLLMAATGVGALSGALYLASRRSVVGLIRLIPGAAAVFGVGLIAFCLSRNIYLSLPLLMVTGFGFMVQLSSSNTLIQTIVEDNKRGRVMSLYAMAFQGMAPWGSLLAGSLAHHIGAPVTLLSGGIACVAGALLFWKFLPNIAEEEYTNVQR